MFEHRLCVACQRRDCIHAVRPTVEDVLTPTEERVLRLIAVGEDNTNIAHQLDTTQGTVKVHASHIYRKLGVAGRGNSRVRAALWVRDHPDLMAA